MEETCAAPGSWTVYVLCHGVCKNKSSNCGSMWDGATGTQMQGSKDRNVIRTWYSRPMNPLARTM